ncbi:hypothetical protein BH24ACT5_BH24ACT5_01270 [soil metagenome]
MDVTTTAELGAAIEAVRSYRHRVTGLVARHADTDRDDLVTAIYEAERSLGVAARTLQRALRAASTR